jgi:hypothetical protein
MNVGSLLVADASRRNWLRQAKLRSTTHRHWPSPLRGRRSWLSERQQLAVTDIARSRRLAGISRPGQTPEGWPGEPKRAPHLPSQQEERLW